MRTCHRLCAEFRLGMLVFALSAFVCWIDNQMIRAETLTPTEITGEDAFMRSDNYVDFVERSKNGDGNALKTFFGLSELVDGASADEYGSDLLAVIESLGDEKFSCAIRDLTYAYKERFYGFIDYQQGGDEGVGDGFWFIRKYPLTYNELRTTEQTVSYLFWLCRIDLPKGDGDGAAQKVITNQFSWIDTTYDTPHGIIFNIGNPAIDALRKRAGDTEPLNLRITENKRLINKFEVLYLNSADPIAVRNSAAEFAFYCLATIEKSKRINYVYTGKTKEINELIGKECLDYDGKVSSDSLRLILSMVK